MYKCCLLCADVTVTEPLLNLLQAHAIGIEQTGTTMAQIVKADTLHLVCDQKIREMLTQKSGLIRFPIGST